MLGVMTLGTTPAWADDPVDGPADITVNLTVPAAGALTMTVDNSTPVVLQENGSDATNRRFTGTLPLVTVTDTRTDVPADVAWSVVGQSTDFVNTSNSQATISNEYLGWLPKIQDVPAGDDTIIAGDEVESTALDGEGLTSGVDLLVGTWNSQDSRTYGGQWTADAELNLVAPADEVATGSYTSTLTLSLFEY